MKYSWPPTTYKKAKAMNVYSHEQKAFLMVHPECAMPIIVAEALEGVQAIHSPIFEVMHFKGNRYKPCPVCQQPFVKWRKR